jgi:hypothetical protein
MSGVRSGFGRKSLAKTAHLLMNEGLIVFWQESCSSRDTKSTVHDQVIKRKAAYIGG